MHVFFVDTLNIELYIHVPFCSTFHITFVGSFHTDFFYIVHNIIMLFFFFVSDTIDIAHFHILFWG